MINEVIEDRIFVIDSKMEVMMRWIWEEFTMDSFKCEANDGIIDRKENDETTTYSWGWGC